MTNRLANGLRRFAIERFARREFLLRSDVPYVSFTFDDFPRTALTEGGQILQRYGARGTYFVSFGLLDSDSPSGRIASMSDLQTVLREGHELGCHTFDHVDGSMVTSRRFERSIRANQAALADSGLSTAFRVFAYPLNGPGIRTKAVAGTHFVGCRFGGQTFNQGVVDLTLLKAFFIDKRSRENIQGIAELIAANAEANGWLIFATHDVMDTPSAYGCAPGTLESLVGLAVDSGARVLPMAQVCAELGLG